MKGDKIRHHFNCVKSVQIINSWKTGFIMFHKVKCPPNIRSFWIVDKECIRYLSQDLLKSRAVDDTSVPESDKYFPIVYPKTKERISYCWYPDRLLQTKYKTYGLYFNQNTYSKTGLFRIILDGTTKGITTFLITFERSYELKSWNITQTHSPGMSLSM